MAVTLIGLGVASLAAAAAAIGVLVQRTRRPQEPIALGRYVVATNLVATRCKLR
jgi:hypothetical protein